MSAGESMKSQTVSPEDVSSTAVVPASIDREATKEVVIQEDNLSTTCNSLCGIPCWLCSWFTVQPRQVVLTMYNGKLGAVDEEPGCHHRGCCCRELRTISTASEGYDTPQLKVVDAAGVPVLVSAVVMYRVVDAKAASFNVQDYKKFVQLQATAALKLVVQAVKYDDLRKDSTHLMNKCQLELDEHIVKAGCKVDSFVLNELNYAPEMAAAMLKRQQASALIDAREIIADGAVSIASSALQKLEVAMPGLRMSDEQKVRIVTNLLTITTGDDNAQPTLSL